MKNKAKTLMSTNIDTPEPSSLGDEASFLKLLKVLDNKGSYYINHNADFKFFTNADIKSIKDNLQNLFGLIHIIWLESTENCEVNERGELIPFSADIDYKNSIKLSEVKKITISCAEDLKRIQSFPYVYIISINSVWVKTLDEAEHSLEIQYMECNLRKKKVTFTISEDIFDKFNDIADKLAINKSKFVENKIKEVIELYK